MASREDMGSWLEGAPQGAGTPGLDLPPSGPGSLASLVRRVIALMIDWAASMLVATVFFGDAPFIPLAVFGVMNLVLVGSIGTTLGHRILGIQVVSVAWVLAGAQEAGGMKEGAARRATQFGPGFGRAAVRTALLCLVIPAVVWDADGRGLHDRAAGTLILRRR